MTDIGGEVARRGRGGPLEGVRVVDAGDEASRFASKLLAEMGAEVVRIRDGEAGPPMATVEGGLLDWWFDGGTSLLRLDLGRRDDRAQFLDLAARADLVLDSGEAGRLERAGLGAAALAELNPTLVQVSLTPFGSDGPRAGWQSSDLVMAAAGGILSVNGLPDEPVAMWGRQMDNIGGLYVAICALACLARGRATGRGAQVELSQQQTVVSCSEHVLMFWWWPEVFESLGAPIAQRQASLHWSRAYEVVPCARGYCMVAPAAGGVPQLIEWMAERGHAPALPADPAAMSTPEARAAFMAALHSFAAELDATEVFLGGQARHVPFGEVLTIPQVAESPQHAAREFFRRVEGVDEEVRVPGPLARFWGTACPPPLPPPAAAMTPGDLDALMARWSARGERTVGTDEDGTDSRTRVAAPLAGIRIVDFTHVLAGPFATRLLADLGADVVKIQTDARAQGAYANDFPYTGMWNRSKSSITLNMADRRALDVLRRLVEQADVVIENFSAGVLEGWGADWSTLSAWNERLIYLSMHGAGADGPWRNYVTYAPTVHALSGVTALTGPVDRLDCGPGVALNDHVSGLAGALALLGALEARHRTGRGQHVDLSQLEVATYLVGPALVDWQANGREARAAGTRDPFTDPVPNDVVRCGDGDWLAITARDDAEWNRLSPLLGAPEGYDAIDVRRQRRDEIHDLLAGWAEKRRAGDAADVLQAEGVPAAVVQNAAHLTGSDPQLRHREWLVSMESGIWGTQHADRFPAVLRDADGTEMPLVYRGSPYLGQHNFDVYARLLGLDDGAIAERMGDGLFT